MTTFDIERHAVETMVCPYCGAVPRWPCRVRNLPMRKAPTHIDRMRPVMDAYWAGIEQGQENLPSVFISQVQERLTGAWNGDVEFVDREQALQFFDSRVLTFPTLSVRVIERRMHDTTIALRVPGS